MILGSSIYTSTASDLITLVKPRITALVVATTAAGLWMAPVALQPPRILWTLVGTVLLVGAANALNMYLERDVDALMRRTRNRPLPARRLAPEVALWFGISLATVSIVILTLGVNPLTALLGVIAFISYVLFYTPLKQKSHVALLVGAVPGAMPPLMGWTAATYSIDLPSLVLFFILFLWQIPHFLAIALFHKEEYERAGIKILPLEKGERAAKHWIVRYLVGLVAVSLYPVWLRMAGEIYFWTALLLGAIFFLWGCYGLRAAAGRRWAISFFLFSIFYLPAILLVLVVTRNVVS
jgi:protoheme IX farnesyltransferase